MTAKILVLVAALIILTLAASFIFRKSIRQYNAITWSFVELFWYMVSFAAVCAGIVEIERIENLDEYRQREKSFQNEFQEQRNFIYAQTWLLRADSSAPITTQESVLWFHKMKTLLDEGWQSSRWEIFTHYSRYYIFKDPGIYADVVGSMSEFNWPTQRSLNPDKLFLRDEIRAVLDSVQSLSNRKQLVLASRPEENTNYHIRYLLVGLYLTGLSMKLIKILADYKRIRKQVK